MFKNKLGEDSPISKLIHLKIHLKIQRWDGVQSLTTLEEGEFTVPIDGALWLLQIMIDCQQHAWWCAAHCKVQPVQWDITCETVRLCMGGIRGVTGKFFWEGKVIFPD